MATAETPAAPPPRRRLKLALAAAAGLAAAWGLFGFLLAPRLLKGAIEEQGSEALHRAVTVQRVEVNPYSLRVAVLGLAVAGREGAPLLTWEGLHVRLAPWKALSGDLGIAEIRLERPHLKLRLDEQGRLDVRDLLGGEAEAPAPPEAKRPSRIGLALDRLEVLEAEVAFVDASVAPTFQTTLGPLTVRLRDFRTKGGDDSPYAFEGATEAGETFSWSGTVLSEPLRSAGTLTFKGVALPKYGPYLRGEAPELELRRGTAGLTTRYQLELAAGRRVARLEGLSLTVAELALARRGEAEDAVALPSIAVEGVEVDLLGQAASVREVKLSGGAILARRGADGALNLVALSRTRPSPPGKWTWKVGAVGVEGLAVAFEDLAAPRQPARLALADVRLRLSGLAKASDEPCPLAASLRLGAAGALSVKGAVRPFAPSGELAVEASGLPLTALTPWLDGLPVRLADGTLGLGLQAGFDAAGAAAAWSVKGDVRVEGLSLRHPAREEELVRWRSLEVSGIDAASAGRAASVRTVRLTEPRLRAVIFEDGSTGMGKGGASTATPASTAAATSGGAWRTSIGLFQIVRGRAALVDRSVSPPVLAALTDVEARVAGLSSDPRARSTVDVKARVDGAAPVTVTGTLNPLQARGYTELAVAAKAVDLTPLGPYAGKYLGYGLQKGKLDLDLRYKVEEGGLAAGNLVRVDQLTLGEKVESPDATGLPVRLGLALLKDKDGVILLDVPVEGRLDDPEFRLGRVIWRTILNLLVKVATSPFAALGALVGGGQADLSLVEFAPGGAALDEAAQERIRLLARSLAERPALALELEGTADAGADGAALRRAELERRLRAAKGAAQQPPVGEEAVAVGADERPRWVAALHAAAFPPAPAAPPARAVPGQAATPAPAPLAPPTTAELEEQLLGALQVPPEALPALAAARAAAAREALLAAGVDPARLFQVEGSERAAKEKGARAYFSVQSR